MSIFFIEDEIRRRELSGVYNPEQLQVMKNVFEQVCKDMQIPSSDKERRQTLALYILNATVQTMDEDILMIVTKEKMGKL